MINATDAFETSKEYEEFYNKLTRLQIENKIRESTLLGVYECVIEVTVANDIIKDLRDIGYIVVQEIDTKKDIEITKISWKDVKKDKESNSKSSFDMNSMMGGMYNPLNNIMQNADVIDVDVSQVDQKEKEND